MTNRLHAKGLRPGAPTRGKRRGVVAVEYAFLLVVVAVPAVAGLIAGGVHLVNGYTTTRNQVLHVGP